MARAQVFGDAKHKTLHKRFAEQRRRIASKVMNSQLLKVTFVTLHYFKATMEYNRPEDILHVMRILGHKSIRNTLVYTHLVDFGDEEYVSKAVWTLEDASRLIESGFD